MKIKRVTDYTVRLLMYLASKDVSATSMDLSEKLEIPFNHLSKIVQNLSRRGYLLTRKGKGGGLKLAKNPKNISLAEIVELTEGPMTLNDCLFDHKNCSFSKSCKFRKYLGGVQSTMRKLFSDKTIFDLVAST